MKKCLLLFASVFLSLVVFAQDDESPAYKTGYTIGRIVGVLLVVGIVAYGLSRLIKKR